MIENINGASTGESANNNVLLCGWGAVKYEW